MDGDTESSVSLQHKLEEHSYEGKRLGSGVEMHATVFF